MLFFATLFTFSLMVMSWPQEPMSTRGTCSVYTLIYASQVRRIDRQSCLPDPKAQSSP